jgi:hypothetical protein
MDLPEAGISDVIESFVSWIFLHDSKEALKVIRSIDILAVSPAFPGGSK